MAQDIDLSIFFADAGGPGSCPRCGADDAVRAGRSDTGKQRYRCRSCRRVYLADPGVPKLVRVLVDRMCAEGISPAIITRVLAGAVSQRWVYARRASRG